MTEQSDARKDLGRSRWLAMAAVTVVTFLTLAAAEILVRLFFPYNTPETVREYSLEYETAVYARSVLKPVNRVVEVDSEKAWGGKSGDEPSEVAVFISSNGYRGPAFDVRKPDDTLRIIVLGGSSVFDQGTPDRDPTVSGAWPHLLQRELAERGVENAEVINAGIPGHTTSDSLGRFSAQLWLYDPDYVLVYHGWNDIKYWKSRAITPERPMIAHVVPYDPDSNPFTSYRGFWDRLFSNSQLYVKFRNKYFMSQLNVGSEGLVSSSGERGHGYDIFGPEQFRLNLELIVAACRVIGATPVLVTQGTLVAAANSEADRKRINYDYQALRHDTLVDAFEESYAIVRGIGARTGATVIDVAPRLNGVSALFSDHVHLTPNGSAALAVMVADGLLPVLAPGDTSID